MTTANINLKKIYFDYKVLPVITGNLKLSKLREILKQLKANTVSVLNTLGGKANGYLDILVSTQAYATVAPRILFVPPLMPAALVIGPNNTIIK